jgi:hypothetical protein
VLAVRTVLVLVVGLSMALALAGPGEAADPGMVRVDIHRPANDGLMSSIGCIITIAGDPGGGFCHDVVRGEANRQVSGGTTTVLLGGDRVTCEIKPGVSVQAFTPRALRGDGYSPDAPTWQATILTPKVHPGEALELTLVPKTKRRAYVGGWLLRPSKAAPAAASNSSRVR